MAMIIPYHPNGVFYSNLVGGPGHGLKLRWHEWPLKLAFESATLFALRSANVMLRPDEIFAHYHLIGTTMYDYEFAGYSSMNWYPLATLRS